jgi:DNA modification methylase
VELVERCVLALTNKGDTVLDPFGGSGSTLIAAAKRGRRVMMIDRDSTYIDIAKERLRLYNEGSLKTREIGTPIAKASGKTTKYPDEWKIK